MSAESQLEFWQSGPVDGIPALLQPVAHAILQAQREINEGIVDFPNEKLFEKPFEMASVAFHLQHLSGVLDRLFTYARNESLSETQLAALRKETEIDASITIAELLDRFSSQVEKSLLQLKTTDPDQLLDARGIGRKKIPTNVLGLLFHAAEHTTRHTGQLLVTLRVVKNA